MCDLETENVLIHDAARPLINQKIINLCIEELKNNHAVIPIINCEDSIIDNITMKYINRDSTKIIQTPQAFKFKKILEAYERSMQSYTDDFSVLLNSNSSLRYKFINGYKKNLKITTKQDFKLTEFYMNEK